MSRREQIQAIIKKYAVGGAPTDYIHYWDFAGDTLTDKVGSNNLTASGTSFVDGRGSNRALSVTTMSQRVIMNNAVNDSDISVSMWLTVKSMPSNFGCILIGDSQSHIDLAVRSTGVFSTYDGSWYNSSKLASVDALYNVTWTKNGNNLNIYINGINVLSQTVNYTNPTHPIKEISSYLGSPLGLIAYYEDIKVWDRELSGSEALEIYNEG